ncbi:MAG: hypothetical protein AABX25_03825, partial [Nanoarchaeota archaeon]
MEVTVAVAALVGGFAAKMPINKLNKILILVIALVLALLLSGCPNRNDEIYPVTEEQYLLGWALHNVNDATPTELGYSYDDLAIYNYSYNYPANASYRYDNILFWIAPFQTMAGTSWVRLGVPQNRVYYLKGDKVDYSVYGKGWSFSNSMKINYLTSEDNDLTFLLDVVHEEHYNSESIFYDINPVPGQKEHIYFGTSPFTPASVVVSDNLLKLNNIILRGYDGKSYLKRNTLQTISTPSGVKEVRLPPPKYKIYLNAVLIKAGNLTICEVWDYKSLNEYLAQNGNYRIEVEIPSGYPIFATTKIDTRFTYNSNPIELPVLKHIEFSPRFKVNEPIPIRLVFENEDAVKEVVMYYKTDLMQDWVLLANSKNAELVIKELVTKEGKEGKASKIDFKFMAATAGGSSSYEIYPISLKAVEVGCSSSLVIEASGNNYITKEPLTFIRGRCIDENQNPVEGLRVKIYEGGNKIPLGEYLGAAITYKSGEYNLTVEKIVNEVSVKFDDTGVYTAKISKKCSEGIGLGCCNTDRDCPPIACIQEPCPKNVCVNGECVIKEGPECTTDRDCSQIECVQEPCPVNRCIDGRCIETTCDNNICEEGESDYCPICVQEPCPKAPCRAGTCPQDCKTSNCTDSDGGLNYYTKGKVTLSDGQVLEDVCGLQRYEGYVIEYYCGDDSNVNNYKCPNGCKDGACISEEIPETKPVYRLYNSVTGDHFYTLSEAEKDNVIKNLPDYAYEGIGFYAYDAQSTSTLPVYRLYNSVTGDHFYTLSEAEKDNVIKNLPDYAYEGIGFYAYDAQSTSTLPVYRLYNSVTGDHFYTISEEEKNKVLERFTDYNYEGIGFYAYKDKIPFQASCSEQGGDICTADEICPGSSLTASDTDRCCSVQCTTSS